MAGEKKGRAFEALTCQILSSLGYELGKNLHWDTKPDGFPIKIDIYVGSKNQPETIFLLTSTGSASNSHMKFWRNMAELFAAKTRILPSPRVISVSLEGNMMEGFSDASSKLFDKCISLSEHGFYQKICTVVEDISTLQYSIDKDSIAKVEAVANKKAHIGATNSYKKCIADALVSKNEFSLQFYRALTQRLKDRENVNAPGARKTFLKRGVAKCAILHYSGILENHLVKTSGKWVLNSGKHSWPIEMGFARSTVSGVVICDPEIEWVLKNYDIKTIVNLCDKAIQSNPDLWGQWCSRISTEADKEALLDLIRLIKVGITEKSFSKLISESSAGSYKRHFYAAFELLKSQDGKDQSYGYSELARDVGYDEGINRGYKVLADWANGVNDHAASTKLLDDVFLAVCTRLNEVDASNAKKNVDLIAMASKKRLFESKVVCHEKLEPIPWLIESAFKTHKISFERIRQYPSCIGEMMGTPSKKGTPVLKAKGTLVHWKSGYDSGKTHKVKELSGRIPTLLVGYNESVKKFQVRSDVKKAILIVDGTWEQGDLTELLQSGWDEIFYPDELDQLAAAIV